MSAYMNSIPNSSGISLFTPDTSASASAYFAFAQSDIARVLSQRQDNVLVDYIATGIIQPVTPVNLVDVSISYDSGSLFDSVEKDISDGNFGAVLEIYGGISRDNGCDPRRASSNTLLLTCQYHSSDYNFNNRSYWFRTSFRFIFRPNSNQSGGDILVFAMSEYCLQEFDQPPQNDDWRTLEREDYEALQIINAMLTEFEKMSYDVGKASYVFRG